MTIRIAMGESPGERLIFARVRHDWRAIGLDVARVQPGQPADLKLFDEVAPSLLASWYLRQFTCDSGHLCDPAADAALNAARLAPSMAERQVSVLEADRIIEATTSFIPLGSPVRWFLVSPRLTGFRPNMFARHPAATLIADRK